MKLDPTDVRYITIDAWRVLSAVRPLPTPVHLAATLTFSPQVEQGSKNHELVPIGLIAQISGARSGGVMKCLGELAKRKLVAKIQNAKCMLACGRGGGCEGLIPRVLQTRATASRMEGTTSSRAGPLGSATRCTR